MKRLDIATDALCDGCGNEHRACTCARPATAPVAPLETVYDVMCPGCTRNLQFCTCEPPGVAPAPLDGAVAREVAAAVAAERARLVAWATARKQKAMDRGSDDAVYELDELLDELAGCRPTPATR